VAGEVVLTDRVVSENWSGRPVVIMPYFHSIPKEERGEFLRLIETTLLNNFHRRGYIHRDVRWPNIGYTIIGDEKKAIVYDLSPDGEAAKGGNTPGVRKYTAAEEKKWPKASKEDVSWISEALEELKAKM
jgi:hypothetical protein